MGLKVPLKLEDGEPNDPAVLVTAVPNWTVGETFSTGRGHELRILRSTRTSTRCSLSAVSPRSSPSRPRWRHLDMKGGVDEARQALPAELHRNGG